MMLSDRRDKTRKRTIDELDMVNGYFTEKCMPNRRIENQLENGKFQIKTNTKSYKES